MQPTYFPDTIRSYPPLLEMYYKLTKIGGDSEYPLIRSDNPITFRQVIELARLSERIDEEHYSFLLRELEYLNISAIDINGSLYSRDCSLILDRGMYEFGCIHPKILIPKPIRNGQYDNPVLMERYFRSLWQHVRGEEFQCAKFSVLAEHLEWYFDNETLELSLNCPPGRNSFKYDIDSQNCIRNYNYILNQMLPNKDEYAAVRVPGGIFTSYKTIHLKRFGKPIEIKLLSKDVESIIEVNREQIPSFFNSHKTFEDYCPYAFVLRHFGVEEILENIDEGKGSLFSELSIIQPNDVHLAKILDQPDKVFETLLNVLKIDIGQIRDFTKCKEGVDSIYVTYSSTTSFPAVSGGIVRYDLDLKSQTLTCTPMFNSVARREERFEIIRKAVPIRIRKHCDGITEKSITLPLSVICDKEQTTPTPQLSLWDSFKNWFK